MRLKRKILDVGNRNERFHGYVMKKMVCVANV